MSGNALTVLRKKNSDFTDDPEADVEKFELEVRERTRSLLKREVAIEMSPELADEAKSLLGYLVPSDKIALSNFERLLQENNIGYFMPASVVDYQIDWMTRNISLWKRFFNYRYWYLSLVVPALFGLLFYLAGGSKVEALPLFIMVSSLVFIIVGRFVRDDSSRVRVRKKYGNRLSAERVSLNCFGKLIPTNIIKKAIEVTKVCSQLFGDQKMSFWVERGSFFCNDDNENNFHFLGTTYQEQDYYLEVW